MSQTSRRDFVKGLAAAAGSMALPFAGRTADAQTRRPNIIFIYTDDVDAEWVGAYGGNVLTPHIDGLARDGMRMDRFYVTSAVCTPSRHSALTGRYASRSRALQRRFPPGTPCNIRWNTNLLPGDLTVAHPLREAGYATGIVGKLHQGGPRPPRDIPEDADPTDPEVVAKLVDAQERLCDWVRGNFGFDYAASLYQNNIEFLGLPEPLIVHNLEWVTDAALRFVEQNSERPFFLYMATTLPHGAGRTALDADPRATPVGMLDEAPDVQPPRDTIVPRLQEAGVPVRWFEPVMTWIDDAVGAVLQKLADLGIDDNTIIVWASDHQARGKMTCYEGARVPCIIRWPGLAEPGARCDELAANIDLAPTFWDAAGASVPAGAVVDGRSLVPIIDGTPPPDWRDDLLLQICYANGVVTGDWKYIALRYPEDVQQKVEAGDRRSFGWDGTQNIRYRAAERFPGYFDYDQLYNLAEDPLEQKNLAGDPAYAEKLAEMKARLRRLLAPLPHSFGEFKPGQAASSP